MKIYEIVAVNETLVSILGNKNRAEKQRQELAEKYKEMNFAVKEVELDETDGEKVNAN